MEENFNTLALEFVKELSEVFPEEKVFSRCIENFESYEPKKFFTDVFGPYRALVAAKDESILDKVSIGGIDMKGLWASVSDSTKEAIWAYGSTLSMLATALDNTPKELMSGIESLAQEFSEKMEKGELDMNNLFGDVMSRVQQMDLSSMQNIDIASLTKNMGIDPNMIAGALGGIDPSMIQNMMGLMGGDGESEEDLLKILENAKRPAVPPKKKSKKSKKNKK